MAGHVLVRRLVWLRCLATAGSAAAAAHGQSAAEELVAVTAAQQNEAVLLETRILLSLIQHAQGNLAAALAALRPAVLVAAQRGVLLFFLAPDPTLRHLLLTLVDDPEAGRAARTVLDALARLERAQRIIQGQEGGSGRATQSPAVAAAPAPPWQERLTRRELQILQLLDQQLSNKEIAQILVVAPDTVRNHLSNLFAKLDVSSRTQAVYRARALGLLDAQRG
jgi:LuxR family maltose regulon positive regulatory protein